MKQLAVFCDFDGTITRRDSLDALMAGFLGTEERGHFARRFREGQTSLWELLDASLRACSVPLEEAIHYLHAHVELDHTFPAFHAWCLSREIPLEVVSAGVDAIVQSYLTRAGLALPVHANRADPQIGCFGLVPLTATCPTGVDKARVVAGARAAGRVAVFVGDGFSDRLAVREADWIYAKSGLASFCTKEGIPFEPYDCFGDIQAHLSARLAAGT